MLNLIVDIELKRKCPSMFDSYVSKTRKSKDLYERAKRFLPAGVSYAIRHFEPYPFYTAKAKGSKKDKLEKFREVRDKIEKKVKELIEKMSN